MPDFLSRLVERTFGMAPVAQPVIGSMFAPMPAIKSDYIQGLARDSEPVSNQDGIHIDSARETTIIPRHDNQPAINRKRQTNKIPDNQPVPVQYVESGSQDKDYAKPLHQMDDLDNQSASTSVQRPLQQKEPFRQNGSNFPEQVESVSLHEVSEQDNQYPHTPPAKLELDDEPLYQADSDPKPMLHEEQFHDAALDAPGHVEQGQRDFADVREETFYYFLVALIKHPRLAIIEINISYVYLKTQKKSLTFVIGMKSFNEIRRHPLRRRYYNYKKSIIRI